MRVLADMEAIGVAVDEDRLKSERWAPLAFLANFVVMVPAYGWALSSTGRLDLCNLCGYMALEQHGVPLRMMVQQLYKHSSAVSRASYILKVERMSVHATARPDLKPGIFTESRDILTRRMEELERIAHEMVGQEFELTTPGDVSDVLFKVLGLPPPPCAAIRGSKHLSTKVRAESARHAVLTP